MIPGTTFSIANRFIGILLIQEGGRRVHTIEPGSVLTIKNVNEEEGVVEVECNYLRLPVSRGCLERYGLLSVPPRLGELN
jgi:hypothetical protein